MILFIFSDTLLKSTVGKEGRGLLIIYWTYGCSHIDHYIDEFSIKINETKTPTKLNIEVQRLLKIEYFKKTTCCKS